MTVYFDDVKDLLQAITRNRCDTSHTTFFSVCSVTNLLKTAAALAGLAMTTSIENPESSIEHPLYVPSPVNQPHPWGTWPPPL